MLAVDVCLLFFERVCVACFQLLQSFQCMQPSPSTPGGATPQLTDLNSTDAPDCEQLSDVHSLLKQLNVCGISL